MRGTVMYCFQCPICDLVRCNTNSPELAVLDLMNHIYRVHNKMPIECPICKARFNSVSRLRSHVKREHMREYLSNRDKFERYFCILEASNGIRSSRRKNMCKYILAKYIFKKDEVEEDEA